MMEDTPQSTADTVPLLDKTTPPVENTEVVELHEASSTDDTPSSSSVCVSKLEPSRGINSVGSDASTEASTTFASAAVNARRSRHTSSFDADAGFPCILEPSGGSSSSQTPPVEQSEQSEMMRWSANIDYSLIEAMQEIWPLLCKAATQTTRQEYETLASMGVQVEAYLGKVGPQSEVPVSVQETIENDIRRSAQWTQWPQADSEAMWPLPSLDDEQLRLLRKILLAFVARADELIKTGNVRIHARYVPGWNYLARLLLFTADFDDFATFQIFEGLMLEYGMAHFADPECTDQLWSRVFARYDEWYGSSLGQFGRCCDAQHFFRSMSGTTLQTSGFTMGLPPLAALRALATTVEAGTFGSAEKLEELLTGSIARSVRLSGVRPKDLDKSNPWLADRAMVVAKATLTTSCLSQALTVTDQLRIALRLQQKKCWEQVCDAVVLRLTMQRIRGLFTIQLDANDVWDW